MDACERLGNVKIHFEHRCSKVDLRNGIVEFEVRASVSEREREREMAEILVYTKYSCRKGKKLDCQKDIV
jgi:hypothetical protein